MNPSKYVSSKNHEGYADPTAHAAISNIVHVERERDDVSAGRCNMLVKAMKYLIDLAGFDLIGRIELRDRETGREYR